MHIYLTHNFQTQIPYRFPDVPINYLTVILMEIQAVLEGRWEAAVEAPDLRPLSLRERRSEAGSRGGGLVSKCKKGRD